MKIAFKIHSQNPNNQTVMNMYPWLQDNIQDHQSDEYIRDGWQVLDEVEYEKYKELYKEELDRYEQSRQDTFLRVRKYLHSDFFYFHPSKIDFTIHLKQNILLRKEVEMYKSGRPKVAKYYSPDTNELVCEIKFEFVNNSSGFMISRKELLGYYQNDGTCTEYYTIHHRTYDFNNINQATESMNERVSARSNIIQEIKIVINSSLIKWLIDYGDAPSVAMNKSLVIGKDFFAEYRFEISDFIEVASPGFKQKILLQDKDVENPKYPWLEKLLAPNVTLRNWIYDRLTY